MRVEVKIPGGVKAYAVDDHGTKYFPVLKGTNGRQEATELLWLETYVSGIIRSILYADDEAYRITGYRRLNPVPNKAAEKRFLEAAARLFVNGIACDPVRIMVAWQLGSDAEVQVATIATNHLTSALLKYFSTAGRFEQGVSLFTKLRESDPEVNLLLAQLYLDMGTLGVEQSNSR
jgi:Chs5-Arf1p-binding protein BUD7/BCH1